VSGSSTEQLTEVCEELSALLADLDVPEVRNGRAYAGLRTVDLLMADADIAPAARRRLGKESRTPGNTQVFNAITDAHEMVRRLESALRWVVTGNPGLRRGGSWGNTIAALASIPRLAEAVTDHDRKQATRMIYRATRSIGQLPAVDTHVRLEKIRRAPGGVPPRCPGTCGTFSLRVAISTGTVMCVYPGDCRDLDGRRPQARLEISQLTGDPQLVWHDGTTGIAPPACHVQAIDPPEPEPVHEYVPDLADPAALEDLDRKITEALT
jgi:hypothetical protein